MKERDLSVEPPAAKIHNEELTSRNLDPRKNEKMEWEVPGSTREDETKEKAEQALKHHQSGRLEEAKELYREILEINPRNADAWHLLGVLSLQQGSHDFAIKFIGQAIFLNPSAGIYHNNLGTALKSAGKIDEAIASYNTALSISPDSPSVYHNLGDLFRKQGFGMKAIQFFHKAFLIDKNHAPAQKAMQEIFKELNLRPLDLGHGMRFAYFDSHTRGQILTGVSLDGNFFIKIKIIHHPLKVNTLEKEAEIMQYLNSRGCMSCPRYITGGTIPAESLLPWLDTDQARIVRASNKRFFSYIVDQYVESDGTPTAADMLLSVIEQKNLGVYNGDLKPDNLRFDRNLNICFLIDYDQAEFLDENIKQLDNPDFFEWCDQRAQEKYNFTSFLQYFRNLDYSQHVLPLFRNGAFNLGETALYKSQKTTLAKCGIYHSIKEKSIYADGERDLSDRIRLLEAITFEKDEKVLDIGCNAGLLSRYLHDRGCNVTGIDLDPSIIRAAKIISNILQKDIRFECWDIDIKGIPGTYNTVMLFSVLHHTRNVVKNAGLIANASRRIIIECRLVESGAKPELNRWTRTSEWKFSSVDAMVENLEKMFPGFMLQKNHGGVDRERYILEFSKKGGHQRVHS